MASYKKGHYNKMCFCICSITYFPVFTEEITEQTYVTMRLTKC